MAEALKMKVADVTFDTKVNYLKNLRLADGTRSVTVYALMPNGQDGPWIGSLRPVPRQLWPEWAREDERRLPLGPVKLWEFYPVVKNGYALHQRPVGMAWGRMGAALALREYIASRNT